MDGNCLFRAISVQLYGTEEHHGLLRGITMDYIEIEKDFFSKFLIGEERYFEEYILMKRESGRWGDDIEIEALSEIYNRPIQIYAYKSTPMRTFHENLSNPNPPIRLSYHCCSHFNAVNERMLLFNLCK